MIATLVIAGACGQKIPSPLWWGWVHWPGGEAMCCSLSSVVHASPLSYGRVLWDPAWHTASWGAVCVPYVWLALWCEPMGKGGVECNAWLALASPAPQTGEEEPIVPVLAPRLQPVAVCGHSLGCLA